MSYSKYNIDKPSDITTSSVKITVMCPETCAIGLYGYSISKSSWTLAGSLEKDDYSKTEELYTYHKVCGGFKPGTKTKIKALCYPDGSGTEYVELVTEYFTFLNDTKYTLTYNINGADSGSAPESVSVTKGNSVTLNSGSGFSKTGHGFGGWSINGTTYSAGGSYTVNSDVTATAVGNALKYKYQFYKNDNTTDKYATDFEETYGDNGKLPSGKPSGTGYNFKGWFSDPDGGNQITTDMQMQSPGDGDLYAQGDPATYKVTFNANGGSVSPTSKNVTYKSTYGDLPTPSRTGYEPDVWGTSKSGGDKVESTDTVEITSAQTLGAHGKVKSYEVKFYLSSSTSGEPYHSGIVEYNKQLSTIDTGMPSNPSLEGYTFKGGGTSASGGNPVYSSTTITDNKNVFAHGEAAPYDLSLVVGDGISTIYYKVNDNTSYSATTSTKSVKANYDTMVYCYATAKNYYNTPDYHSTNVGSEKMSTSGLYFEPTTTARKYTLTYDANGGSGDVPSSGDYYTTNGSAPVSYQLGSNNLTRDGYKVRDDGRDNGNIWDSQADGNGTHYTAFSKITFSNVDETTKTVYAAGVPLTYKVYFDTKGGTATSLPESLKVTYNGKYEGLPASENVLYKTGYHCSGWYYQLDDGTEKGPITASSTVEILNDTTFYPKWINNTYTVVYNGNGSDSGSTSSTSHIYDKFESYLATNRFGRMGYYFEGGAKSKERADNNIVDFQDGELLKENLTAANNGTYTLYAVGARSKSISVKVDKTWELLNLDTGVGVNIGGTGKQTPITSVYVKVGNDWKTINIT